jgi:general stress protein CsbA
MWINFVCAIVFFLCVPGILFTIPTNNVYLTTALHSVVFVIAHHTVNAYLKKNFGMEEPRM